MSNLERLSKFLAAPSLSPHIDLQQVRLAAAAAAKQQVVAVVAESLALSPLEFAKLAEQVRKEWDESKHPRDDRGRFSDGGGGGGSSAHEPEPGPAAPLIADHVTLATLTLGQHLGSGKNVTAAIRATALAHPDIDARHLVAAGKAHGLNPSTVRIQVATARGNPWKPGDAKPKPPEDKPLTPKPPEDTRPIAPPPPPTPPTTPATPAEPKPAPYDTLHGQASRRIDFSKYPNSGYALIPTDNKAERARIVKDVVKSQLAALGMASQRVTVSTGAYEFKVGEKSCKAAGQFSPSTKRISVYLDANLGTPRDLAGLVRHEALHARFANADKGWMQPTRVKNFVIANFDKLKAEDGTTNYSKAYWTKANSAMTTGGAAVDSFIARSAVNESLAEMHNAGYVTPTYQKLNSLIDRAWQRKAKYG